MLEAELHARLRVLVRSWSWDVEKMNMSGSEVH